MRSWIITGGVACGKSLATQKLGEMTAGYSASFSSDDIVQKALQQQDVITALTDLFGPSVLLEGGVNRGWLREKVLAAPEQRAQVEGILHPLVLAALEDAREHARKAGMNLFLAEVPLHYEIGAAVSADFVIVVASSRSVQVRRMMETRGLDEHSVHMFLAAQWPVEAKVERADAVIWNDGSLASLSAQVLTLASPLMQA